MDCFLSIMDYTKYSSNVSSYFELLILVFFTLLPEFIIFLLYVFISFNKLAPFSYYSFSPNILPFVP